jgi:hypothetical protein
MTTHCCASSEIYNSRYSFEFPLVSLQESWKSNNRIGLALDYLGNLTAQIPKTMLGASQKGVIEGSDNGRMLASVTNSV